MRVIFTPGSRAQLRAIHDYIARDDKFAARAVVARVEYLASLLGENPDIGRKLQNSRLRRFPVRPYPYLIYYEVTGDVVRIIRVRHAARRPTLHEPVPDFPPGGGMTEEEIQALLQSKASAERLWPLTEAERADLEEAIREVERGEIASDAQVAALFRLAGR